MKAAETIINDKFYSVEAYCHAAERSVRVLARTKPAPFHHKWIRQSFKVTECYWVHQRWARFIKWMLRGKYRRKLIPYPLECLANATEVASGHYTFSLPEAVWDSIYAQIAEIHMDNRKPMVILIGRKAYYEVIQGRHVSMYPPFPRDDEDQVLNIAGVPAVLTPKLEDNAVVVVPK